MATTKAEKVQNEIEKVKGKLAEMTAKLKELEQRKTDIENSEIVDVVRGMSIPLDQLATLLQAVRSGAVPSGVVDKMSTTSEVPPAADDTDEEDIEE
ncbi:MAG: DUF4315 family protein [Oscillospiraceae bacterium]|nr:DUF4315 family protein [Oscillospiraceae bacterium]